MDDHGDQQTEAPIGNEYGSPYVRIISDGTPVFGIDCANGFESDEIEVSQEFFDAFVKEFGDG